MQRLRLGRQVQTANGRDEGTRERGNKGTRERGTGETALQQYFLDLRQTQVSATDEQRWPKSHFDSFPCSLVPCLYRPCFYDATANCGAPAIRVLPLRGPRLRALITLMRSSNSCAEQVFL